ncbi:S8 family serine peptidase [Chryseobacterium sp. SIMBA_028]|uniref:S8 family serine peptidase n=1 Tax=Chryseobacterium sp. SIMBA_028 TaxID=3085771 RepID=UPI00397E73A4
MKKIIVAAFFLTACNLAIAQQRPNDKENTGRDLMTWYHKDFKSSKVYGVNTENAYKYLESKGLSPKKIVVGVLDSGVQVDHPGLVKNLWTNPNEVPGNGKDDDGNGFVDDIHGWNFIGGKNGDIDVDNLEVTRVVKTYKEIFEGEESAINKDNQSKMPEDFAMYIKAKELYDNKSPQVIQHVKTYTLLKELIPNMVRLLGGKSVTAENIKEIKTPTDQKDAMALEYLTKFSKNAKIENLSPTEFEKIIGDWVNKNIENTSSKEKHYNINYDPRAEIVGDDYNNYSEKYYGNNHYEGPDAEHGTHVAGIIAGSPQGDEIQYGVAEKVAKIMTVRIVPNGDERDKDVANAVRYAVDNGAKILNMSFGKPISPGKEVVWDAFKYAESKGVLLVKAAGNENEDIGIHPAYPTNFKNPTDTIPLVNNVIVVGASTNRNNELRANFSNFNKSRVNVFAPGEEIYSTVPKSKYAYLQGTSMASPVVAGAAAVLLAYMPNLKPHQIIEALVKSSNSNTENKFDSFSQAGGVIDMEKAAIYAYTHYYKDAGQYKKSKKQKDKIKKKVII